MEFDSRAWAKNWRDKNNEGRLEREKEREQECLQEFSRSRPILPSFSPRTISERSTSERLEQARGHNSCNFFSVVVFLFTLNVLATKVSALSRLHTMFYFISVTNTFFELVMLKWNGQKKTCHLFCNIVSKQVENDVVRLTNKRIIPV